MTNPSVTIGIPNYNGAKYIRYAIESVLNQRYSDFELIITDDGSSDESVKIIQEYQNYPEVRVIISKKNRGLSYRLNEQIEMARGKYFCRMDSDDIMLPNRLEKQVEFLERHPEVDVVGSSAIVIGEDNKIIGTRAYIPDGKYSRICNGFIHPTIMGKASFFKKNQYSEQYSGAEDTELWLRCRQSYVFKIINEPLLFYRDPLKLRVKTYLSRLSLIKKLLKDLYESRQIDFGAYLFKITRIECQKLCVRVLNVFKLTSVWAKQRNTMCRPEIIDRYQSILNEQTNFTYSR